jgi:hypothetical protein
VPYKNTDKQRAFFNKRQKTRRERWRSEGLCVQCGGTPLNPGSRRCRRHADQINALRKNRSDRARAEGRCTSCSKGIPATDHVRCEKCLNRNRRNSVDRNRGARDWRNRIRVETFRAYGGACACCGETESLFLEVDHIDGGGSEHRKTVRGGSMFYSWLKKQGFPKDKYRLLCRNCNYGRFRNGGECPHRTVKP